MWKYDLAIRPARRESASGWSRCANGPSILATSISLRSGRSVTRLVKRLADGAVADAHRGDEGRCRRAADLARAARPAVSHSGTNSRIALDVGDHREHLLGGEGDAARRLEGRQASAPAVSGLRARVAPPAASRSPRRHGTTSASAGWRPPARSPWRRRCGAARRTRRAARSASTGACRGLGCRYWPMVRKSTPAERRSSMTCITSSRASPRPTMIPDLVKSLRSISLARCNSRSEWK